MMQQVLDHIGFAYSIVILICVIILIHLVLIRLMKY